MKYLILFCGLLCLAKNLHAQNPRYALVIGNERGIVAAVWLWVRRGICFLI